MLVGILFLVFMDYKKPVNIPTDKSPFKIFSSTCWMDGLELEGRTGYRLKKINFEKRSYWPKHKPLQNNHSIQDLCTINESLQWF